MFKVIMRYSDGSTEDDDEVFETEEEARAHGLEQCSNFVAGGEVLHMHNPGDYPLAEDNQDVDFDVIEVEA